MIAGIGVTVIGGLIATWRMSTGQALGAADLGVVAPGIVIATRGYMMSVKI